MKTIRLADNLTLPVDVVTQTVAVIAKRRVGKSYLARRFTEQLHAAGQQVVIVDPKGDWWGIRSSADGKGPGLPIIIFGGERADVPLEPGGGEVVAKFVVEERVSALLDLSLLRKHEVATFMTAFLETLYRLKAREQYRTPLMMPIDEADAIAPQMPQPNEARMLGAIEDIVRRGGYRGIGCMLITQRTAVLNKNVLTQAQALIALRTIAPQDLKAMKAWIDVHGEPAQRDTLMESLPALPVGTAWVWSPGWPTERGIFEQIKVAPITTFDSGATPKPGQRRVEPKKAADVDLEAVRRQMAETIERAKADDPKVLRARIAELERAAKQAPVAKPAPQPKRVEVPALNAKDRAAIERAVTMIDQLTGRARSEADKLANIAATLQAALQSKPLPMVIETPNGCLAPGPGFAPALRTARAREAAVARRPRVEAGPGSAEVGTGGLRRILIALAQRPNGLNNSQIGVRAQLAQSGSFRNYISKARINGWLSEKGETKFITDAGRAALGTYDPLPAGDALREHWLGELGGGTARMLAAFCEHYPNVLTNDEVAAAANLEQSGSFRNYMSKLRTLELIERKDGGHVASAELFS